MSASLSSPGIHLQTLCRHTTYRTITRTPVNILRCLPSRSVKLPLLNSMVSLREEKFSVNVLGEFEGEGTGEASNAVKDGRISQHIVAALLWFFSLPKLLIAPFWISF